MSSPTYAFKVFYEAVVCLISEGPLANRLKNAGALYLSRLNSVDGLGDLVLMLAEVQSAFRTKATMADSIAAMTESDRGKLAVKILDLYTKLAKRDPFAGWDTATFKSRKKVASGAKRIRTKKSPKTPAKTPNRVN